MTQPRRIPTAQEGLELRVCRPRGERVNPFLTAAGKYRLHSMASLVAVSVHASTMFELQKETEGSRPERYISTIYRGFPTRTAYLEHDIL